MAGVGSANCARTRPMSTARGNPGSSSDLRMAAVRAMSSSGASNGRRIPRAEKATPRSTATAGAGTSSAFVPGEHGPGGAVRGPAIENPPNSFVVVARIGCQDEPAACARTRLNRLRESLSITSDEAD